jgi:heme exporter protein D
MRNSLDFSSWQGVLSTLLGLVLVSLIAVSIRLLVMQGVQQRRERQNRQINERLKTLIAAYKTLGGSFTGNLAVDPSHLKELRSRADAAEAALDRAEAVAGEPTEQHDESGPGVTGSDRRRRIRDAVEAALSDVILLGTQDQVRLAIRAANDMVAGRVVETAELVISLRTFIREVLGLEAISGDLAVPKQGPVRSASSGGRRNGAARADGGEGGGGRGGSGGKGGGGMGAGAGAGGMAALGIHHRSGDDIGAEDQAEGKP